MAERVTVITTAFRKFVDHAMTEAVAAVYASASASSYHSR